MHQHRMQNVRQTELRPRPPRLFDRFEKVLLPSQRAERHAPAAARPSLYRRLRGLAGRLLRALRSTSAR